MTRRPVESKQEKLDPRPPVLRSTSPRPDRHQDRWSGGSRELRQGIHARPLEPTATETAGLRFCCVVCVGVGAVGDEGRQLVATAAGMRPTDRGRRPSRGARAGWLLLKNGIQAFGRVLRLAQEPGSPRRRPVTPTRIRATPHRPRRANHARRDLRHAQEDRGTDRPGSQANVSLRAPRLSASCGLPSPLDSDVTPSPCGYRPPTTCRGPERGENPVDARDHAKLPPDPAAMTRSASIRESAASSGDEE